jgi:hypothetical protein
MASSQVSKRWTVSTGPNTSSSTTFSPRPSPSISSTVGQYRLPSRRAPQSTRAPALAASRTHCSTRLALPSSIIDPHDAVGSSGDLGSIARARASTRATKASAIGRYTYRRCTLMHTCPA